MKHSEHTITRVKFETVLERRERVVSVQDRISAFAGSLLQDVLTDGLSRFDGSRRTSVFHTVELDLGEISLRHLERDLEEGIARQLRAWALRKAPWPHYAQSGTPALLRSPSAPDAGLEPASESGRRENGESPARLQPGDGGREAMDILDGLNDSGDDSNRDPSRTAEQQQRWWTALRNRSVLRARVAAELTPEQRPAILQAWMPRHYAAVLEFAVLLSRFHSELSLVSAGRAAFERQLWRCILDEAADFRPAGFSLRTFLRQVVARLALYHSVSFRDLARQIAAAWKRRPESTAPVQALSSILQGFNAQDTIEDIAAARPSAPSEDESGEAAAVFTAQEPWTPSQRNAPGSLGNLARFLEWGSLPWSGPSVRAEIAESEMLSNLESAADQVCAMVRSLGENASVRKRIAGQFSDTVVERLIGELDPVNATWMLLCTKQLRLLHQQKPLIAIQNRAFGQLLSELTLEYLSERHWHALDAVSFLRFLLRRLAYRQKVGYEVLLADLALRRSPDSSQAHPAGEIDPQSRLSATIVTLLETDLLGIRNRLAHAPRFAVRREFRHLYRDLDVLAYWIRWRKLPPWSHDDRPLEVAQSLEPLLDALPPDCGAEAAIRADRSGKTEAPREISQPAVEVLAPALEIERWLLFGLWPAEIEAPEDSALDRWLRDQTDADWLRALERCEAQDPAIRRIARLSQESVLRIAGLLSGPNAESVHEFLLALQAIGRPLEGSFPPPWEEHVNRFALARLLQNTPAERRSSTFLHHLAQTTLFALSLSFQISYERLLLLMRRECDGPSSLKNLCATLADELESRQEAAAFGLQLNSDAGEADGAEVQTAEVDAAGIEGSEMARIYLLSGRLPARAAGLGFATCRQIARRLSSSALESIAEVCAGSAGQRGEILRRAERLLPPEGFLQLKQLASSREHAHLEERTGESPRQSRRQTGRLDERPRLAGQADSEPATGPEMRSLKIEASRAERDSLAEEMESLRGRLDALAYFLRSGVIPWWGDRELSGPSSEWLRPLLEGAPDDLLHVLRSAASSPCAIERLLRYVPCDSIAEVIRHAEPGFGGMMALYLRASEELANDDALTAAQRSSAAAAHWRSALQLILDADQPRRSFTGTLEYLAARISQQLSMSAGRYLERLARVAQVRTEGGGGNAVLAGILLEMRKTIAPGEAEAGSGPDDFSAQNGRRTSRPTRAAEQPAAASRAGSAGSQTLGAERFDGNDRACEELSVPVSRDVDRELSAGAIPRVSDSVPAPTAAGENGLPDRQTASIASGADRLTLASSLQQPSDSAGGNGSPRHPAPEADGSAPDNEKEFDGTPDPLRRSPGEEARSLSAARAHDAPAMAAQRDDAALVKDSTRAAKIPGRAEAPADTAEEQAPFLPDQTTEAGQFEYLLRFGALPESSPAGSPDKFMRTLTQGIGRNPEQYRKLIARLARGAMERRRMVRNLPAEVLEAVWKLLLPSDHAVATLCMEELAAAAFPASSAIRREECRLVCGEELIESSMLASGKEWEVSVYLRRALLRLSEDRAVGTVEAVANLRGRFSRMPEPLRTRLIKELERAERETARIPIRQRPPVSRSPGDPRLVRPPQKPASQLPAGEPFYIANAGAILLWPYLGRYFQTLGLSEKNAFHDEARRSRAIYLVQYLATGAVEAPEHALLLNKILCGAAPEQPIDAAPVVSDEEAALSAQLLQAVIANWGKLGNTSINGLRESFLIRDGRLLRNDSDNSWALTVSAKGYDVLLDGLPWGLSMIRLPWMQTLLKAKWR